MVALNVAHSALGNATTPTPCNCDINKAVETGAVLAYQRSGGGEDALGKGAWSKLLLPDGSIVDVVIQLQATAYSRSS